MGAHAIAVLIVLLAYVPSYGELAGRVFEMRQVPSLGLLLWWGPRSITRMASALSIETYSQYGVGYLLLVSSIAGRVELSYGKLIRLGVIYGCVYLVALAVGLRIALVSRLWSSCCVLLCLLLQYFNGVNANSTIWTYPSGRSFATPWTLVLLRRLSLHCQPASFGGRRRGGPGWSLIIARTGFWNVPFCGVHRLPGMPHHSGPGSARETCCPLERTTGCGSPGTDHGSSDIFDWPGGCEPWVASFIANSGPVILSPS